MSLSEGEVCDFLLGMLSKRMVNDTSNKADGVKWAAAAEIDVSFAQLQGKWPEV